MNTRVASLTLCSPTVLFERQRQALRLLHALGGEASNIDFQKMLFLFCQESGTKAPYDFVPYQFGAFSFTSYADRCKLIGRGLLEDTDAVWHITERGLRAIGGSTRMQFSDFARRHRHLRGDELIAETYRRFPYFAIRSEIADRVLKKDPAALVRIMAARTLNSSIAALHTIGYEGHTLESYLNRLLATGVTLLCDVRRNAISRKYGFSKNTLARGCESIGIRYEHLPELGIASELRKGLDSQAAYDALFDDYERTWLLKQSGALNRIHEWMVSEYRVALTCYEHLPEQCHRHCVAEALEARFGKKMKANHL